MRYFCAKCGAGLDGSDTPWSMFYSVWCRDCGTYTNVKAESLEEALEIVGMTEKDFTLNWYRALKVRVNIESRGKEL